MKIKNTDLRIEVYRTGAVNNAACAVRLTHTPTGIQADSGYYRSQLQNTEEAFMILKRRLKHRR